MPFDSNGLFTRMHSWEAQTGRKAELEALIAQM